MTSMWTRYRVEWIFPLHKLCASVPADPDIVKKWLEARQPAVRPPAAKTINEIQEEVFATIAAGEAEAAPSLRRDLRYVGDPRLKRVIPARAADTCHQRRAVYLNGKLKLDAVKLYVQAEIKKIAIPKGMLPD